MGWAAKDSALNLSRLTALAVAAAAILCAPTGAAAATYPADFEEQTIVSGLTIPTMAAYAPDGRLFIVEKGGRLKVVAPGGSTATTILDISGRVNSHHDRGLLGLAVDSSFAINRYVYLLYTYDIGSPADSPGAMVSRLSRFTVSPTNVVTGEQTLLGRHIAGPCPAPSNTLDCFPSDGLSHSIGTVRSAPDGTLWVGSGDAASFHIVDPKAMDTYNEQSLAGKLMHIDREGRGLAGHPFCPADANLDHVCTKLHAKGFRNPFRFALRPNGGITLGDVGWNTREEIDLIDQGGRSYGWPCYEGKIRTPGYRDDPMCAPEYAREGTPGAHVAPNHDYQHGESNSVMGGPTYTGSAYPGSYSDSIFFADYSGEFIRRLVPNGSGGYVEQPFATDWSGTALEEDLDKNLFYPSFGNGGNGEGSIRRIVYSPGNRTPTAIADANPTSGPTTPLTVAFDGRRSTDPDGDPLTYSWDFGDGNPLSSQAAPSHTYANPGTYDAKLTVSDGSKSHSATVRIDAGNVPPEITVSGNSTYRGGETFRLSAAATDAEDGQLPPSAFDWDVRVIHAAHDHFSSSPPGVAEIDITAVTDHDADSFYRVIVTATDSDGAQARKTVEVRPQTTTVRLRSAPSGAPLSYGGIERITPQDITTTIGFRTTLTAPASFTQNGTIFDFASWSDGGARLHDYSVPPQGGTLVASFSGGSAAPPAGTTPDGGGGTGAATDRTGPRLRVTGVSASRGRVRGTALDRSGVRRVQIALRRPLKKGGCAWWLTGRKGMSTTSRRCDRPRWLPAVLTRTTGGARWLAKLGAAIPAGRYRVLVRAYDGPGNASRLSSGPGTIIRVAR